MTCPLGKLSAPSMVRPMSGLSTYSARTTPAGTTTAASTAPDHLRVSTQARTSAAVIRLTGNSVPAPMRKRRMGGYWSSADWIRASAAESSHPVCPLPARLTPKPAVTAAQAASSAAAGQRSGQGSSRPGAVSRPDARRCRAPHRIRP